MSKLQPDNIIENLADIIGATATMRIISLFGGTMLYVPVSMPDDHPLVNVIGLAAARRLSAHFSGEYIDLPIGSEFDYLARVRRVAGLLRANLSGLEISQVLNISTSAVSRMRMDAESFGLLPAAAPKEPSASRRYAIPARRPARTGEV